MSWATNNLKLYHVIYKGEQLERNLQGWLRKPKDCANCPLVKAGLVDPEWGFVPDEIAEDYGGKTDVYLWEQNPGKNEEDGQRIVGYAGPRRPITEPDINRPTIGSTGYDLERNYLSLARLERRKNVSIGNTIRCRLIGPGGERTNNMPKGQLWHQAVIYCSQHHLRLPASTRLIVACGDHAWRALGQPGSVSEWRGYTRPFVPDSLGSAGMSGMSGTPERCESRDTPIGQHISCELPILCTYHLSFLNHAQHMEIPTRRDYSKIPAVIAGKWPKPIPPWLKLRTVDDIAYMEDFFEEAHGADWIVCDTEYHDKFVYMIGLGFVRDDGTIIGCQLWRPKAHEFVISAFFSELYSLITHRPMVFQNADADIPVLGWKWERYFKIHCTMQANTILWSSWPDALDFQGSMFSDYPRTKHLEHEDLELYNWGDVLMTIDAWKAHLNEFKKDPASYKLYEENVRLYPVIRASMDEGLRVNQSKVQTSIPIYRGRMKEAERVARTWAGWPINVGSPTQQKRLLYDAIGMPKQKHIKSKQVTTDKDAIGVLRKEYLGDISGEEPTVEVMWQNVEDGGHPFLEAMYLYQKAEHVLTSYLYPLVEGYKRKTKKATKT